MLPALHALLYENAFLFFLINKVLSIDRELSVAFRSAKVRVLSRSERRLFDSYLPNDPKMLLFAVAALLVFVWFLVELKDLPKALRMAVGFLAFGATISAVLVALNVSSRFQKTFEVNNIVKNLTEGLVSITSENHDHALLKERLRTLNADIVPSYEESNSARDAIDAFLNEYGIQFREEMPIHRDTRRISASTRY